MKNSPFLQYKCKTDEKNSLFFTPLWWKSIEKIVCFHRIEVKVSIVQVLSNCFFGILFLPTFVRK